jgi:neutral ceramidase
MLRAGVARCLITPAVGMTMFGYAVREGVAAGKDSDLWATALVLADEQTRVTIIGMDLGFIPNALGSSLRRDIAERLGVHPSHVLVNASHTHCGPTFSEFQYDDDQNQHAMRQAYVARLRTEIPNLVNEAARQLTPARLGTATGEARIGINRRELGPDGMILLGEDPSGPVDHEVRVVRVDDLQ